ncbi:MAG: hypothetical protein ABF636_07370 [Acetobacter sp.]
MLAFSEHRRSSPSLNEIRPGMGASRSVVRSLEERSDEVGVKMTDLRRILFHGILECRTTRDGSGDMENTGQDHGAWARPLTGFDPAQSESVSGAGHPASRCHV